MYQVKIINNCLADSDHSGTDPVLTFNIMKIFSFDVNHVIHEILHILLIAAVMFIRVLKRFCDGIFCNIKYYSLIIFMKLYSVIFLGNTGTTPGKCQ